MGFFLAGWLAAALAAAAAYGAGFLSRQFSISQFCFLSLLLPLFYFQIQFSAVQLNFRSAAIFIINHHHFAGQARQAQAATAGQATAAPICRAGRAGRPGRCFRRATSIAAAAIFHSSRNIIIGSRWGAGRDRFSVAATFIRGRHRRVRSS